MKINILLALALILTLVSEQKKTISKGKFQKCKIKNFIINNKSKKYIYQKKNVKKFVSYFNKSDIILKIKQMTIMKNDYFTVPLNVIWNLSNIFFFMFSLNYYNLINENHRKTLLEITDNINSKIFLFNTINDIIKVIPKNFSFFLKIFIFSIAQFFSQIFISNLTSFIFYSKNNKQEIERKKKKDFLCDKLEKLNDNNDITYTENNVKLNQNNKEKNNENIEITSNKRKHLESHLLKEQKSKENEIDHLNYKDINEINNNIKSLNYENIYNDSIRKTILKHMCVLSHTGFIPIFIFNQILKKLNFINNDINILINFYILINGFMSKIYVQYFTKKNELILNEKTNFSSLKLIFFNSYTYFILISLFLNFFHKANFIYEKSVKQLLLMFNNILIPSILIIISNILYEGFIVKSSFYIKDLIYIFNNKYLLYPIFFFILFHLNNHYKFFHIKTNLQLFLLIQSMTPPNYNIYFLNKKFGDLKEIKKILSFSYFIYLIPLYFYSLILYKYFKDKNI
ncbi:conserved Plasmodium membrane protein, unknown function [Plasmodium gallinaceum]|uniref:Apicoplast integral membrane protein n=1 Tax=Plasmodium gallinaceum TaxID=5849 RepID=A0A1J1H031_PLAGA|nr:conserved Plasmodium membrane protein, unknown function [Plasmodium gallinaceum]CRG96628.1 conserved Plasmodium membrane protein, unknown function [Plasmodium gallinaceum]